MNTPLQGRGGTVGAVNFSEDDTGLRVRGELLDTQAAKDYAAEARAMGEAPVITRVRGRCRAGAKARTKSSIPAWEVGCHRSRAVWRLFKRHGRSPRERT